MRSAVIRGGQRGAKLSLVVNDQCHPDRAYAKRLSAIIDRSHTESARVEIRGWPGYEPTPLVSLPGLALAIGIDRLWCKDEGARFAPRSFKALGGAYAVQLHLQRLVGERLGRRVTAPMLVAGDARRLVDDVVVACASDGNHGAAVAWGARMFGCRAVIYLPRDVSEERAQAIERFGAEIRRVDGVYDQAVARVAADCRAEGWTCLPDTSAGGDSETPTVVMRGYSVMAEEILSQLPKGQLPTHVFLQGGVGGLAAAVVAHFWQTLGRRRPRFIVVEPASAACLSASAAASRPTGVNGDLRTVMGCLSCGEVSRIAWEILQDGVEGFVTMADDPIGPTMTLLASGVTGDPKIVAGESGAAGIAALICALDQPDIAQALGLAPDSRVLTLCTEGAIDSASYQRLTGLAPAT